MEYVQEQITTLHDFGEPAAGRSLGAAGADLVGETAIVVPMTDREHESPAAARVLTELEGLDPAAVIVPVRAAPDTIGPFREWLESFSLPISVLWCTAPAVEELLDAAGLANGLGKGRDVWLALGPAAVAGEYVVVHDADARSYEAGHVHRLLAPLTMEFQFSKGYYARIEDGRLYGRLFRLFYEPLMRTLAHSHDEPIVDYLGSFRYALAGEFAATAELAKQLRTPHSWGLEVATLGDAFDHAGFANTAQVDLGRHVHDHRGVTGDAGLATMSRDVAQTLLAVLESHGVDPDYDTLPDRFRQVGEQLIEQYRADAAFNGLSYDPLNERNQLDRYADSIAPPETDRRLPPWQDAPITPEAVREATQPWVSDRIESSADD